MSSILTNNGAQVALQTLKSINSNLAKTQSEISTGKSVGSARDSASVWSISKVMESDVSGFEAISSSLNLGSSTLAVARSAAERITDLLGQVKENIISSQEENVDRTKINEEIGALRNQIQSISGAAQFNGLNLLSNTSNTAGTSNVAVLSSLNRSSTGNVQTANINVGKKDLGTSSQVAGTTAAPTALITAGATVPAGTTATPGTFTLAITGSGTGGAVRAGDTYTLAGVVAGMGATTYVARDGESASEVAKNMLDRVKVDMAKAGLTMPDTLKMEWNNSNGITFTNTGAVSNAMSTTSFTGGTAGGGLAMLGEMDVRTKSGAAGALAAIEALTQTAIKAAAEFGTAQKRVDIQNDFVNALTSSLKSGIGSLVDADMEEASARLQALQVQQQLGVQALSIANQAPQTILSLFR